MTATLPTDANNNPIPVLKPVLGNTFEVDATAASARIANPLTTNAFGVYATTDCFIKIGDSSVTASGSDYGVFIPSGAYREYSKANVDTHIAVIKAAGADDGKLWVNGLQ